MKNIQGLQGSIGDAVSFNYKGLSETTLKSEFAIHGFDSLEELETVAEQRGHAVKETTMTSQNEWVYNC